MYEYTAQAKTLIDERFGKVDYEGIHFSHQSIYGYRQGHAGPFAVCKRVRSSQILKYPTPALFYSFEETRYLIAFFPASQVDRS